MAEIQIREPHRRDAENAEGRRDEGGLSHHFSTPELISLRFLRLCGECLAAPLFRSPL